MDGRLDNMLPANHQGALLEASAQLVEQCFEDLVGADDSTWSFDQCYIADHLPRKYLPDYTPLFTRRFLICLATVGWKLAQPQPPSLSCVAEELALRAIIAEATAVLEEHGVIADFARLEDELLEDADFETLFNPSLDGIDQSPHGEFLGMGSLSFRDWFEPFPAPRPAVHPYLRDALLPDQNG